MTIVIEDGVEYLYWTVCCRIVVLQCQLYAKGHLRIAPTREDTLNKTDR